MLHVPGVVSKLVDVHKHNELIHVWRHLGAYAINQVAEVPVQVVERCVTEMHVPGKDEKDWSPYHVAVSFVNSEFHIDQILEIMTVQYVTVQ